MNSTLHNISEIKQDIFEIQKEMKELDRRNTKLYYYMSIRLDKLDRIVQECLNLQKKLVESETNLIVETNSSSFINFVVHPILFILILLFLISILSNSITILKQIDQFISTLN